MGRRRRRNWLGDTPDVDRLKRQVKDAKKDVKRDLSH
jgi:hypothetical protein